MGSSDTFEAVSHPLRIEIIKALAENPTRFADLKRRLKIGSSGLLDFHLKKLKDLVTVNGEGCYTLTEKGFSALQAVETVSRYGWQRRAFYVNVAACTLMIVYIFVHYEGWFPYSPVLLSITAAWLAFYSYWTFVKRRIRLGKQRLQTTRNEG